MGIRSGGRRLILFAIGVLTSVALLAPSGAVAASVVNGNFETGSLKGWHSHRATGFGDWFAYKGTEAPFSGKQFAEPVQEPPQGTYAATTDEVDPDSLILYQDVALEPGAGHKLSLTVYYNSYEPISIPTPDSLSVDSEVLAGQANQQYRIDVMKPEAPLESLNPADILLTVFQTEPGDPEEMKPKTLTADLTPFAGQTVRLRIANTSHMETFNAGIDDVSISSTGGPGQPKQGGGSKSRDSAHLSFGKLKLNRADGTATLPVRVAGPGRLTANGKPGKAIVPASAKAGAAGTATLRLKPTPSALGTLKRKHKLRVKVAVTYKPAGGSPETATVPVTLKLKAGSHRR
jgi:hypothetical protein